MKCLNKVISIIITCLLLVESVPTGVAFAMAVDNYDMNGEKEIKTYSNATLEDEFADDRILVVLNKSTSKNLKTYDTIDFAEVKAKTVKDLMWQE